MKKKEFALFKLSLLVLAGVLEQVKCGGRSGTGIGASRITGGFGAVWLPGELFYKQFFVVYFPISHFN